MVDFKKLLDDVPKKAMWKVEIFHDCANKYETKYGPACRLLDDEPRLLDRRCGFYSCKKIKSDKNG